MYFYFQTVRGAAAARGVVAGRDGAHGAQTQLGRRLGRRAAGGASPASRGRLSAQSHGVRPHTH